MRSKYLSILSISVSKLRIFLRCQIQAEEQYLLQNITKTPELLAQILQHQSLHMIFYHTTFFAEIIHSKNFDINSFF